MAGLTQTIHFRFWLWLIRVVGVIVPRRLRADWQQEWEAELRHREALLTRWDQLDWRSKLDLLWRSLGALWDALLLQPRRLEDEMFQDLRYGVRMLRKHKSFTVVAVLSLALGIGLSTAIFSLAYGILLRSLPYPEAERLVTISLTNTTAAAAGVPRFSVSAVNWIEWRAQSKSFQDIALARGATNFNLTGDGRPERVQGARASWNLAQVFGVQPLLGRMFTEEEAGRDAKVAVLTYGFWERRFARDPAIVGRRIQLNGEAFEVIGVLPTEFRYPTKDVEVLAPLFIAPEEIQTWGHFFYKAVRPAR